MDLDDCANGRFQVVSLRLGRVEDLHGMRPAGNGEQGAVVKINLELSGIQSGTHYDDLGNNKQTELAFERTTISHSTR